MPPGEGIMKIKSEGVVAKVQNRGAVTCVCKDNNCQFCGASTVVFEGITIPETLVTLVAFETLSLP
jgi:ribosomal protein L24E